VLALLTKAGAEVVDVSCPSFSKGLAAYYLILPSEASSNLAKFDAMRFGLRVAPDGVAAPSAEQVMAATREAGLRRGGQASASSWAPTPCPAATTTPTTARRRRCAR
jgi:Asp-tRNA(Asn)/Glu-tRNA(Gln) amidotransferase A subunit family amidase